MKSTARLLAVALVIASTPAAAQRASLADRVASLEQRAANTQPQLDLLNQVAQLRSEVQSLRSALEEAQQANEQLRSSLRTQYLDVDGRLQRLEATRLAVPAAAPAAAAPAPGTKPVTATPPTAPAPARKTTAAPQASAAERAAYDAAFAALKAGRYVDSARLFTAFLERHPGGSHAPNALYWLGESYYVTQNYPLAYEQFARLVDRFATHDKAPGALLKLAMTREGMRDAEGARAAYADVLARYPDSDAARIARGRLPAGRP